MRFPGWMVIARKSGSNAAFQQSSPMFEVGADAAHEYARRLTADHPEYEVAVVRVLWVDANIALPNDIEKLFN